MPSSAAGFAAAGREKPAVASGAASSMSESFAMGESSLQGMRDTGSRTGETVFRYPATRVILPGRHDFHLGIDRSERRLDWRTKCLHPSTNGRRRGNIMADRKRVGEGKRVKV